MRKIDFHHHVKDRLQYAYAVVKMLQRREKTAAVWCTSAERLDALKTMLWSQEPITFLIHAEPETHAGRYSPTLIGQDLSKLTGEVLVLIDDQLPPNWEKEFERFERIIDIVSEQPQEAQLGRERWKAYKDSGAEVEAYDRRS